MKDQKSVFFSVRIAPELKEQWDSLIEQTIKDYDLKSKGEALGYLYELIEDYYADVNLDFNLPNTDNFLKVIDNSCEAIVGAVKALEARYKASLYEYKDTVEQRYEVALNNLNHYMKLSSMSDETISENMQTINNLEVTIDNLKAELEEKNARIKELEEMLQAKE